MKYLFLSMLSLFGLLFFVSSCGEDACTELVWYQDNDGDGLGNPDETISSCEQPEGYVSNSEDDDDSGETGPELHAAFADFDPDNFNIYIDGDEVVIESNGYPNHTSPYWSNTTARSAVDPMGNTIGTPAATENHPLFVEPTATTYESMAPGNIDDFNGSYTLRIPIQPE